MRRSEQHKDAFQQVSAEEGDLGLMKEMSGCSGNQQLPGCQEQGSWGAAGQPQPQALGTSLGTGKVVQSLHDNVDLEAE